MDDELNEFEDELGKSVEDGPDIMVEEEHAELFLDLTSRVGGCIILIEYWFDELVDQLGESSQLEVDFDQSWLWPGFELTLVGVVSMSW